MEFAPSFICNEYREHLHLTKLKLVSNGNVLSHMNRLNLWKMQTFLLRILITLRLIGFEYDLLLLLYWDT